MTASDWSALFAESHPEAGAGEETIARLLKTHGAPLSDEEIARVFASQTNPFHASDPMYATWRPFDPERCALPQRPLPPAYLDFLRFSNGGSFRNGKRWFDAFLTTDQVRSYLIDYHIPEYLPGAWPFAMDGSGDFYLFDMRAEAGAQGEYPVLFAHAAALGYDEARVVAASFEAACRGTTDPADA